MRAVIDELEAEAHYRRERYDLYRARAYAQRGTSPSRMRELERSALEAEARLAHARERDHADAPNA
jgi:hypothetical protein